MHYVLLALALKFGKENIDYMKLADMKNAVVPESNVYNEVIGPSLNIKTDLENLPDSNESLIFNQDFQDSNEQIDAFGNPYIESNNFAELLPEEEINNIIDNMEVQGPTFLDSIKRRLMRLSELVKPKKKETVLGTEVEGPTFLDTIKEKVLGVATQVGEKIDNITEKVIQSEEKPIEEEKPEQKPEEPKVEVITADKLIEHQEQQKEEEKKPEIVGTLYDSELEHFLKDQKIFDYEKYLKQKAVKYNAIEKIEYKEDEDYTNFLTQQNQTEKTITTSSNEDIMDYNDKFAKIVPVKKTIIDFKTKNIPSELLASRSFQNRHIPKIIQNDEKEEILENIIKNGMMQEFMAFIRDMEDINMNLKNQYNLITLVTKYKQYEMMKYLIHNGVDINRRDARLNNPLIIAVQNNDLEAVKILNSANANLNIVDILKRTPLIYTIENGQEDIGVFLVENGANIDVKNGLGEGTLSMAERFKRYKIRNAIMERLKKEKGQIK